MIAQAKTINLLLYDGNLNGVISIEDSSWNAGELYSAPRDSVNDLLETEACKKYGVYMLLSSDTVYVGQSFDLAKRVTQHTVGKDWWESVVILTTKDDSLNHADIDYLESVLHGHTHTEDAGATLIESCNNIAELLVGSPAVCAMTREGDYIILDVQRIDTQVLITC